MPDVPAVIKKSTPSRGRSSSSNMSSEVKAELKQGADLYDEAVKMEETGRRQASIAVYRESATKYLNALELAKKSQVCVVCLSVCLFQSLSISLYLPPPLSVSASILVSIYLYVILSLLLYLSLSFAFPSCITPSAFLT